MESGLREWGEAQAKETVVLPDNAHALQHGSVPSSHLELFSHRHREHRRLHLTKMGV